MSALMCVSVVCGTGCCLVSSWREIGESQESAHGIRGKAAWNEDSCGLGIRKELHLCKKTWYWFLPVAWLGCRYLERHVSAPIPQLFVLFHPFAIFPW